MSRRVIGPVTYRGKKGCQWPTCTRRYDPETMAPSEDCWGWHCVYCDAPCSYQGHRCEVGETLLAASRAIIDGEPA